jgi:hypothetical protein
MPTLLVSDCERLRNLTGRWFARKTLPPSVSTGNFSVPKHERAILLAMRKELVYAGREFG